jgi:hypothetical protein
MKTLTVPHVRPSTGTDLQQVGYRLSRCRVTCDNHYSLVMRDVNCPCIARDEIWCNSNIIWPSSLRPDFVHCLVTLVVRAGFESTLSWLEPLYVKNWFGLMTESELSWSWCRVGWSWDRLPKKPVQWNWLSVYRVAATLCPTSFGSFFHRCPPWPSSRFQNIDIT